MYKINFLMEMKNWDIVVQFSPWIDLPTYSASKTFKVGQIVRP